MACQEFRFGLAGPVGICACILPVMFPGLFLPKIQKFFEGLFDLRDAVLVFEGKNDTPARLVQFFWINPLHRTKVFLGSFFVPKLQLL